MACLRALLRTALNLCSGASASSGRWAGIKQRMKTRRETKAERKWTKEQIRAIQRDTLAFAVLESVNPDNEEPPPYINVRARMLYHS